MDSFEWNKIAGAILFALLVGFGLSIFSEVIFHSESPETPGYVIAVAQEGEASGEAAASEPVGVLLASADPGAGEAAARKCQACHTFGEGDANKVGPNLWGIVMHPIAAHEGYDYSDAMKAYAEQSDSWTYEHLNTYLTDPTHVVPGTKMVFPGLKKDSERANVIAYLRTLSDDPAPLPEPEAAAAEQPAEEAGAAAPAEKPAAEGEAGAEPAAAAEGAGVPEEAAAAEDGAAEAGGAAQPAAEEQQTAQADAAEEQPPAEQEAAQAEDAAEPAAAEEPAAEEQVAQAGEAGQPAAEEQPAAQQEAAQAAETEEPPAEQQVAQAEQTEQPAAEEQAAAEMPAGDTAKGAAFAKRCQACHTFEEGGGKKVGPPLFGVFGRPIASSPDYQYSDAMVAFSEGGTKSWDAQLLDTYLTDPRGVVPGAKMIFPGIKKDDDRANVIAYLASLHP